MKAFFYAMGVAATLLVILVGGSFAVLKTSGVVVTISEERLNAELAALFPMEQEVAAGVRLTLSEPTVVWAESGDGRLEFAARADAEVLPLNRRYGGRAQISGAIRFDGDTGEFYLLDSRVEAVDVDGVPALFQAPLALVADRLAGERLEREAFYQLEGPLQGEGLLARLPGLVVREVVVADRGLHVRVGL